MGEKCCESGCLTEKIGDNVFGSRDSVEGWVEFFEKDFPTKDAL